MGGVCQKVDFWGRILCNKRNPRWHRTQGTSGFPKPDMVGQTPDAWEEGGAGQDPSLTSEASSLPIPFWRSHMLSREPRAVLSPTDPPHPTSHCSCHMREAGDRPPPRPQDENRTCVAGIIIQSQTLSITKTCHWALCAAAACGFIRSMVLLLWILRMDLFGVSQAMRLCFPTPGLLPTPEIQEEDARASRDTFDLKLEDMTF